MNSPIIYRGQASEFSAHFTDPDTDKPLVVSQPVRYKVRDFKKNLIASGIAEQSTSDPSKWSTVITIPTTAAVSPVDKYYKIAWQAVYSGGKIIERNSFSVRDNSQDAPFDPTIVAMIGDSFNVDIKLPYLPLGGSVRIVNAQGNVLASKVGMQNWDYKTVSDGYMYRVNFNSSNMQSQGLQNTGGLATCFAYINYLDPDNQQQTEIYPIYFCNPVLINLMNDMRTFLDMIRNADIISQLRYTEAKLIHFIYQGMLMFNSYPIQWVQLNFNMLGTMQGMPMYRWVLQCAKLEMLDAMTLAEGMTSFEFSGMAVSLSSDRSAALDNAASKIRAEIDGGLQKVKSQLAMRGGFSGNMGTVRVVFGPNSNFLYSGNGMFGAFGINGGSVLWQGSGLTPLPFLF